MGSKNQRRQPERATKGEKRRDVGSLSDASILFTSDCELDYN